MENIRVQLICRMSDSDDNPPRKKPKVEDEVKDGHDQKRLTIEVNSDPETNGATASVGKNRQPPRKSFIYTLKCIE